MLKSYLREVFSMSARIVLRYIIVRANGETPNIRMVDENEWRSAVKAFVRFKENVVIGTPNHRVIGDRLSVIYMVEVYIGWSELKVLKLNFGDLDVYVLILVLDATDLLDMVEELAR